MNKPASIYAFILLFFTMQIQFSYADDAVFRHDALRLKSAIYQNYIEQHQTLTMKVLKNFPFKGNEKVLDISSGDGRTTLEIAKTIPDGLVIGIDSSDEMVDYANFKLLDLPNAYFKNSSCEAFEFNQRFDLIVSFNSLRYLSNPRLMLRNMKKHLVKGGKILLSLNAIQKNSTIVEAMHATLGQKKWTAFSATYSDSNLMPEMSPEEYRQVLDEIGFKVLICERARHHTVFKTKAAFAAWVSSCISSLVKIPDEKIQEFCTEVTKCYLEKTSQTESKQITIIHFPWEIEAQAK
jgi:trans-aconitate 2-methyltransferase